MNSFHEIPQEIIQRSTILDLAYPGPRPKEEFCGYCHQSFGDHHFACPQATEHRRRQRSRSVRHRHIVLELSELKDTHITFDTEAVQ